MDLLGHDAQIGEALDEAANPISLRADFGSVAILFARFERTGCDGRREILAGHICASLRGLIHNLEAAIAAISSKWPREAEAVAASAGQARTLIRLIEASAPCEDDYDTNMDRLGKASARLADDVEILAADLHAAGPQCGRDLDDLHTRIAVRRCDLLVLAPDSVS